MQHKACVKRSQRREHLELAPEVSLIECAFPPVRVPCLHLMQQLQC